MKRKNEKTRGRRKKRGHDLGVQGGSPDEPFEPRLEASGANQAKRKERSFLRGRNCPCRGPEAGRSLGLPGAEATGVARGKLETDKDPVRWDPAAVPRSSGLSQGGRDRGRDLSGL